MKHAISPTAAHALLRQVCPLWTVTPWRDDVTGHGATAVRGKWKLRLDNVDAILFLDDTAIARRNFGRAGGTLTARQMTMRTAVDELLGLVRAAQLVPSIVI